MTSSNFARDLAAELARSRFNDYVDNYDTIHRLPVEPPLPERKAFWRACCDEFLSECAKLLRQISETMLPLSKAILYYGFPNKFFFSIAHQYNDVAFLYAKLEDARSKNILIKIFAYRILGWRQVKLPRNTDAYWNGLRGVSRYRNEATPIQIAFENLKLDQYDFTPLGYALKVHTSDPGAACVFVQKQYEFHHEDVHCKAESGDVVIDAGSCWGETSIYFAHEVGPNGQVIAFEFIPSNIEVLKINLEINPDLSDRVLVGANPLWDTPGRKLYFVDWGPGSRVSAEPGQYGYNGTCETATIDNIVDQNSIPRVDFIKMDIEGAEYPALKGAEETIRKYQPKLAISLYHQVSDFSDIPRWIDGLDLGYKFYLDHHTIFENETVLFAIPQNRPGGGAQ